MDQPDSLDVVWGWRGGGGLRLGVRVGGPFVAKS